MSRLIIVDDEFSASQFGVYDPVREGFDQVDHVLYEPNVPGNLDRSAIVDSMLIGFTRFYGCAKSQLLDHAQTVEYLRQELETTDRIVLDGLAGLCFALWDQVPLRPDQDFVFTHSGDHIRKGLEMGIPCYRKKDPNQPWLQHGQSDDKYDFEAPVTDLLVVDDTPISRANQATVLESYQKLLKPGQMIRHVYFLAEDDISLMAEEPETCIGLFEQLPYVRSTRVAEFDEVVSILCDEKRKVDAVVLDGLNGACVRLWKAAGLNPDRDYVYSGMQSMVDRVIRHGVPARLK